MTARQDRAYWQMQRHRVERARRDSFDVLVASPADLGAVPILRTNFALQSEALNTTWIKSETTIDQDDILAPDGALTADKLVESINNTDHRMGQAYAGFTDTLDYTLAIYAKAAERAFIRLQLNGTAFPLASYTFFDVAGGTVETIGSGAPTARIKDIGGGWHRCSITATCDATASDTYDIYMNTTDAEFGYDGDGTSGLHLWGAQLEQSSLPTPYIPTTTIAVSAPGVSIPLVMPAAGRLALSHSVALSAEEVTVDIGATSLANGRRRFSVPALGADEVFKGWHAERNQEIMVTRETGAGAGTLTLYIVDALGRTLPIATTVFA